MNHNVDLLVAYPRIELGAEIARRLREAGIPVLSGRSARFLSSSRKESLVVAIMDRIEPDWLLEIGYRIGARLPVLVVADLAMTPFLQIAHSTICIDINDPHLEDTIVSVICAMLGVRELPPDIACDAGLLGQWLKGDWTRLGQIDTTHMLALMGELFERSGFLTSHRLSGKLGSPDASSADLIVENVDRTMRMLVECKWSPTREVLGIGELHRLHAECVSARGDFAMLVMNSQMTPAARAWAEQCVPPLHVLERHDLETLLRLAFDADAGRTLDSRSLLRFVEAHERLRSLEDLQRIQVKEPEKSMFDEHAALRIWDIAGRASAREVKSVGVHVDERKRRYHLAMMPCGASLLTRSLANAVNRLSQDWRSHGIRIWSSAFEGNEAVAMKDLARSLRETSAIVIVFSDEHSDMRWNDRVLQLCSQQVARDPWQDQGVFVVAFDNVYNRLRMPRNLSRLATFVEPVIGWEHSLERVLIRWTASGPPAREERLSAKEDARVPLPAGPGNEYSSG